MWCERVLHNLGPGDIEPGGARRIDLIDLAWDERRNVLRKRSRGGEEIRLLLPPGQRPRHGDVLLDAPDRTVVVNVLPTEVIVAGPAEPRPMAELVLELGNLHWPTELTATGAIFKEHPSMFPILKRLGIPWQQQLRRFEPLDVSVTPEANLSRTFRILRSTSMAT